MSLLRVLAVLVVFAGLAALEIHNGFSRISSLRDNRRRELVETVRHGHLDLARRIQTLLELGRRQVDYVARLQPTQALVAGDEDGRSAEPALREFLAAFADLDSLDVFDADGRELLCLSRRDGSVTRDLPPDGGVGAGPPAGDGANDPPTSGVGLPTGDGANAPPASGAGPPLAGLTGQLDPLRPDPAAALRLGAPVPVDGAPAAGHVLVGLSVEPYLAALASVQPMHGVGSRLMPLARGAERPADTAGGGLLTLPAVQSDAGLLLSSEFREADGLRLETDLPEQAIEEAMLPLRREYEWIVVSMAGFTAALALVGGVVLRLSQRSFRLRETEHYLRWIRRVTDRYRALLEGAADMILIVDPQDGAIREANAAAREALGVPAEGPADGSGPRLGDRLQGDGRAALATAMDEASREGRAVAVPGLRLNAISGDPLEVDARVARVDLGEERVVQVSLRDVTRQRAVERRLQTSERLGSLGLLTAGVAHEINNPLEGIGNYLALAERPGLDEPRRTEYLGQVRRGFARIRDIVQDLLSFARPAVHAGRADLTQVVENALGMAAYAEGFRGITVERLGLEEPLAVAGDPGRLEQVLLNLLLNAARAMDGVGRVQLTAVRRRDEGLIELTLEDEGPGIPPDQLERIFDPFFSGHGGTGLGLAVSFGIVRAHGGSLHAANRAEGGACFVLRLPAVGDDDRVPREPPA